MWPRKTSRKDTVLLALKIRRGCFVFFHEMVSQVWPKEGTQERCRTVFSTHRSWRDRVTTPWGTICKGNRFSPTGGEPRVRPVGQVPLLGSGKASMCMWMSPGHQGKAKGELVAGATPYHTAHGSPGRSIQSVCGDLEAAKKYEVLQITTKWTLRDLNIKDAN